MRPALIGAAFALAGLLSGGPPSSDAAQVVWLDELDVTLSECGWQRTLSRRAVGGNPLKLDGKPYERGVGTHSPGVFAVRLDGGARRLTAVVGIDDEVGDAGSAEFRVLGDGKLLWTSGVVRGSDPAKAVDVALSGVKILQLVVTVAGDGYGCDHTDWADARFEVTGPRPQAYRPPEPDPYERMVAHFGELRGVTRAVAHQVVHPASLILDADRDPTDVTLRRTAVLLGRLEAMPGVRDLSPEAAELARLQAESAATDPADADARRRICDRADAVRRRIASANPLLDFDRIVFIKKHFYPPSEGEGNHMCDQYFGFMAIEGGGLFVLEKPFSDQPVARDLLADAVCENGRFKGKKLEGGGFLSPELSYDGKAVYFAWTEGERSKYQWTERSTYHIFGVHADGTHLRQLTDGRWNDFDPHPLPNGRLVFMSERRGGYGRCHGRPVPVYTLHTMEPDGSDIVCISFHESNEWHPSVNHDGMIVYSRWDYVDRGFNQAHHPWITTPDGRDARAIHGNFAPHHHGRPQMELDVRAIPGSRKYVATAAGHHGQAYGSLVLIDPAAHDDDLMRPVRRLTPDIRFPESDGGRHVYATAWPLSEEFFLAVYDHNADARRGTQNRFGIHLVDAFGNKILLYRDPRISCLSPIPLRPRPTPPAIPQVSVVGRPGQTTTPADAPQTAAVGVVNVYDGLTPWPQGTRIAALRIIQLLPKTTPPANNPRIGHGDQKGARAVLGTVPVEPDGSAHFLLPVNKPVHFQALDEQGLAVQSMRSDTYVQPGETLVCQGCHDPRPARHSLGDTAAALQRPPSRIRPDVDGSKPFSFPRLVQPVLDRHCADCHAKSAAKPKAIDLRPGDWQKSPNGWYASYINLRPYAFFFDGAAWNQPRTIAGKFGARASRLYALLRKGHYDVKLPAADLHRITLWLDANSDFFGSYEHTDAQSRGEIVQPTLE